jgi:hypothetical protein
MFLDTDVERLETIRFLLAYMPQDNLLVLRQLCEVLNRLPHGSTEGWCCVQAIVCLISPSHAHTHTHTHTGDDDLTFVCRLLAPSIIWPNPSQLTMPSNSS